MAGVTVTFSGDDARLQAAHNRLLAEQQKLLDKYARLTDASKKGGDEEAKAKQRAAMFTRQYTTQVEKLKAELDEIKTLHGKNLVTVETLNRAQTKLNESMSDMKKTGFQKALDGVGDYVTSLGVAAIGVKAIQMAWQQVTKEQKEGLDALKGTSASDSKLIQVSGSAEEFRQLTSESDHLAAQEGVDRSTVRDVMFSAISEGFKESVPEIIASAQVLPPEAAAGVAGQVPALFKGKIGGMEAVSMALKAAELSRLDFEPLAQALPGAAEGGAIAGASPEETMATLSVLASRFKSGDTAADRIKAFAARSGIDENLKGKGIIGSVEALQAMSPEDRTKFLGDSQELNVAYTVLSEELDKIKGQESQLRQERASRASGGGALREKVAIANADPRMRALKEEAKAQVALDVTQATEKGVEGAVASGAAAQAKAGLLTDGSFASRVVGNVTNEIVAGEAATLGFSQQQSSGFAQGAAKLGSGIMPGSSFMGIPIEPIKDMISVLMRTTDRNESAAADMKAAAGAMARPGSNSAAARAQAARAN